MIEINPYPVIEKPQHTPTYPKAYRSKVDNEVVLFLEINLGIVLQKHPEEATNNWMILKLSHDFKPWTNTHVWQPINVVLRTKSDSDWPWIVENKSKDLMGIALDTNTLVVISPFTRTGELINMSHYALCDWTKISIDINHTTGVSILKENNN